MKANYLKSVLVIALCMSISSTEAQGIKSAINKAKNALEDVGTKVTGDKNDKTKSKSAVATALAPEVKNSVSEIRTLTGLKIDEFEKKVKGLGYTKTTDQTGLFGGGTIYKSAQYIITIRMGTRAGSELTFEVTRNTLKKKPDLNTLKLNFLDLSKQCTALKAEFTDAEINEQGKVIGAVRAKNIANRSSKFLPALDNMTKSKINFLATERHEETDYEYRITFYYTSVIDSAVLGITVVDKTVDSLEG